MNVVPFPLSDNEPELIQLAPKPFVRNDPWMGLTEAIAWIGSRDKRFSDAAYWWLHERDDRKRDDTFPLWFTMRADLGAYYGANINDAEAQVMASGLAAIGRYCGGAFQPMDQLLWVDVKLSFNDVPDSISPTDIRQCIGKPPWSHIRFKRDEVLRRWPSDTAPIPEFEPELPPKVLRAEVRAWVRARIDGDERMASVASNYRTAFPGRRVDLNREQVREIYRNEFAEMRGASVRPGPRA
jgi:hypothetical protein